MLTMSRVRPRYVAAVWLGWTVLLVAAYEVVVRSADFASVNFAMPLVVSAGVDGRPLSSTAAAVIGLAELFVALYLPPILFTVVWWMSREWRGEQG